MKAKIRGLKRKCDEMLRRAVIETERFPQHQNATDYWHVHLPLRHELAAPKATPIGISRLCAQTLINRAAHLEVEMRSNKSLVKQWNLKIPSNFSERGTAELIGDENPNAKSEMWFMGEFFDA
ncbi:DUF3916 domain-containing protein [bacterium]|nr:MAG: DUF3916 domain-containing protein [bacterium]